MRRRLWKILLLAWLGLGPVMAQPAPPAALLADLQAWLVMADPAARQDFARRRLLAWFDFDAMLARLEGPRYVALPSAQRQARRQALGAFLLYGLDRQRPAFPGWTGRIMATAGPEGLLLLAGRHPDGRPLSMTFVLRREPFGWRVVAVRLDGIDLLAAWCRQGGCP